MQEPNPGFESKLFKGQSPDRAEINNVSLVVSMEWVTHEGGEIGTISSVQNGELGVFCNRFKETNASCTQNAALIVQKDFVSKALSLIKMLPGFMRPTVILSCGISGILQHAFAGFVTNGAVEGVVEEEEFHHSRPRLLDHFGVRLDFHPFNDGFSTGDRQTGSWPFALTLNLALAATGCDR
jgi:hypothetical protein